MLKEAYRKSTNFVDRTHSSLARPRTQTNSPTTLNGQMVWCIYRTQCRSASSFLQHQKTTTNTGLHGTHRLYGKQPVLFSFGGWCGLSPEFLSKSIPCPKGHPSLGQVLARPVPGERPLSPELTLQMSQASPIPCPKGQKVSPVPNVQSVTCPTGVPCPSVTCPSVTCLWNTA